MPTIAKSDTAALDAYLARFDAKQQTLIRAVRSALRKRLPTANELVYDYAASVVISYAPNERGIDAVVALSARVGRVDLYFNQWHRLSDPKQLLQGSAKQVRFITVTSARRLAHPDVEALIAGAIAHASVPLAREGRGRLVFRTGPAKSPARSKAK